MMSMTELKEILQKFEDEDGMLTETATKKAIDGDFSRKERVIEYLKDNGLIEYMFNNRVFYSISRKGRSVLGLKTHEEKQGSDTMEDLQTRRKMIVEYMEKNDAVTIKELESVINCTYSTTYSTVHGLVEDGLISSENTGNRTKRFFINKAKTEVKPREEIKKDNLEKEKQSLTSLDVNSYSNPKSGTKIKFKGIETEESMEMEETMKTKIIDDLTTLPGANLLPLFSLLPESWSQFEGKHNPGQNRNGYMKIFFKNVDDCIQFYCDVRDKTSLDPTVIIDGQSSHVKVELPLAEA